MRVVVTGASGNVGTSLLEALGEDPEVEEVLGIARRVPARRFPKTSWARADVSRDELAELFAGADAVVHLAWLIQPSRDEKTTRRVNVEGSARVFEAVGRAQVPVLVHASSVGAYGPGPVDRAVDESWPVTGIHSSFYSRHKAEVEVILDGFEQRNPGVRVVRLRPALIFKRQAATGIRRLFMGPLFPSPLARAGTLPALPLPSGLRTQAVHSLDVGEAYRLAVRRPVSGAFNIAAEPVLDAAALARILHTRPLAVPPRVLRGVAWASWKLRLQPTSPGWLDMGMLTPLMDVARARRELGWEPRVGADDALLDLLAGLRDGAGMQTPPLDPGTSGPLRLREFATGVGARSR